jgi:hypothetical protein
MVFTGLDVRYYNLAQPYELWIANYPSDFVPIDSITNANILRYIAPGVGFPPDGDPGPSLEQPAPGHRSASRPRLSTPGSQFEEVDVLHGVS